MARYLCPFAFYGTAKGGIETPCPAKFERMHWNCPLAMDGECAFKIIAQKIKEEKK